MTPVNVDDFPVAWRIATNCIHNIVRYKYTINWDSQFYNLKYDRTYKNTHKPKKQKKAEQIPFNSL